MGLARHGFDFDGTFVVAVESLVCGAGRLQRGAVFPWRDLGMMEQDLLTMWTAMQLDCVPKAAPLTDPNKMSDAGLERATAPAEAATAQPAASRRSRR